MCFHMFQVPERILVLVGSFGAWNLGSLVCGELADPQKQDFRHQESMEPCTTLPGASGSFPDASGSEK